jgi:uncharacterized protein (TIGR03435 family)
MPRLGHTAGSRRKQLLTADGLLVVAVPVLFGLVWTSPSPAQIQQQAQPQNAHSATQYEFEVAAVKADRLNTSRMAFTPNGFSATGQLLSAIIRMAYGIQYFQISSGPTWIDSERYAIDAKMDSSDADALQKLDPGDRVVAEQHMLQVLLAERFALKIHREIKELPVCSLVIAKDGPKIKQAKPDATYPNSYPALIRGEGSVRILTAQGISMSTFAETLSTQMQRVVLDKTGLAGKYDFTLSWMQEEDASDSQPAVRVRRSEDDLSPASPNPVGLPLTGAIQARLGLRLETVKGPVEIIVIDHIERPSGN